MNSIIICDSGVSSSQMNYIQPIDIGYGIYDTNGHGSELTRLIHIINSDLNILSIKILDENNCGTLEGLISALRECLKHDVCVICLALSLESEIEDNKELREVVNELESKGKVIVAALHNGNEYSVPAGFHNVIGVKSGERFSLLSAFYDKDKKIQCTIPLETFFGESVDGRYEKLRGNSVACALFAEHVATIIAQIKQSNLHVLEAIFEKQLVSDLKYFGFFDSYHLVSDLSGEIIKSINVVNELCNINSENGDILININSMQKLSFYLQNLKRIELEINKRTFLRRNDLENVKTLADYFLIQKLSINKMDK